METLHFIGWWFLIGLIVMTLALFYFLADGPVMIRSISRLLPLNDEYEMELLQKFSEISRSLWLAYPGFYQNGGLGGIF